MRVWIASMLWLLAVTAAWAQDPSVLQGDWSGTLQIGPQRLRLELSITQSSDGLLLGSIVSVDQGNARIPIAEIRRDGTAVTLDVKAVGGKYVASLAPDGSMSGTWTQLGIESPLQLTPVTNKQGANKQEASQQSTEAAPDSSAFDLPLELQVPVAPTAVTGEDKTRLIYELHVTNFGSRELALGKIEVLAGSRVLTTLEGAELNSSLYRPGAREINDKRDIAGGLRAVAFIDVALSGSGAVPASLRHRVTVRSGRALEGAAVTVSTKPIAIGPPLRGAIWIAGNGPGSPTHGRALIPIAGHAAIAQRFAIDWVQVDASAPETTGKGADNKNYLAYGEEVIAVADATVVAVKDGIAENVPGENSRAVQITLDTVAGNYVMLDLGRQHFALYAHVQPGSLRVKVGDKVRRGQVLGLLGNSGNSTEPHLHFHVTNANSPLGAEGIPYVIDAFEVETTPGVWQTRRNQIPVDGQRVRFK